MEKKYQVFVSSTYQDLQKERQEVMQALLELDCIPVGMELFPAADDDQWTLIKGLISDCDYYVLIVAGRYGSIDRKTGKSYTQMEYEFAIEEGIPVISFVHKEPGNIPASNTEATDEGKNKLKNFIELVEKKMCQFWTSPEDLGSKVSRSLVKLIKAKPRIGWIKATQASSSEANKKILDLKLENDKLKDEMEKLKTASASPCGNFQQGEDYYTISYTLYGPNDDGDDVPETYKMTWNELFEYILPEMIDPVGDSEIDNILCSFLQYISSLKYSNVPIEELAAEISNSDFKKIKIQMLALGILHPVKNRLQTGTKWKLSEYGYNLMIKLIALKK